MRPENWKKHALINFLLIAGISKKNAKLRNFYAKHIFETELIRDTGYLVSFISA